MSGTQQNGSPVKCYRMSRADFQQLQQADPDAIYFINETGVFDSQSMEEGDIYLGENLYTRGSQPLPSIHPGALVRIDGLDPYGKHVALETAYNSASTTVSTSYIPTDQDEVDIDVRYRERSTIGNFYLCGYCGGASPNWKWGLAQPGSSFSAKFHLCWRDTGSAYLELDTVPRVADHVYRIRASLHGGTATLFVLDETTGQSGMVTASYSASNQLPSTGLFRLFGLSASAYYMGSGTHIYHLTLCVSGKPVLNYLPMQRLSDSAVGFLNTVTGYFLTSSKLNAGAPTDRSDDKILTSLKPDVFVTGQETTPPAPGTDGLVPAPTYAERLKFLRGDGTWQTPDFDFDNLEVPLSGHARFDIAAGQLCAFDMSEGYLTTFINPSTGNAVSAIDFPVGIKVYCAAEAVTAGDSATRFSKKIFLAAAASVSAAGNGVGIDANTFSTGDRVYLAVASVDTENGTFRLDGTGTLLVGTSHLTSGKFYVYLGCYIGNGTVTLEGNNPLLYYYGGRFMDWTTYTHLDVVNMTGATANANGAHGLVPAPFAGDQGKVLSGAGTWVNKQDPISAGNGISISNNIISANIGKVVNVILPSSIVSLITSDTTASSVRIDITANGNSPVMMGNVDIGTKYDISSHITVGNPSTTKSIRVVFYIALMQERENNQDVVSYLASTMLTLPPSDTNKISISSAHLSARHSVVDVDITNNRYIAIGVKSADGVGTDVTVYNEIQDSGNNTFGHASTYQFMIWKSVQYTA